MDQLETGRWAAEEQWRAYAMGEEGGSYYGQEEEAYRAGRLARREAIQGHQHHLAARLREAALGDWRAGRLQLGRRLGGWRVRSGSGWLGTRSAK